MFIKLTRFDNRPIWLNAAFVVTVEPRKDGVGSVVVPIGDGFDYDVRESVEEVLGKLENAPAPAVVPVPLPDCLTKTPADVSPEPESRREERPAEAPAVEPKKPRRRTTKAKAKAEAKAAPEVEKKAEPAAEAPVEQKPAEAPKPPPKLELSPDQVVRLGKLAPKSVAKLKNTLATQFHVADVGGAVLALEAQGALKLDGNRVLWPAPAVG